MSTINRIIQKIQPFWGVTGFVLVIGMGIIDVLTGYELAFSLFYLLPISLVTWFAGGRIGIVISIASALSWFIADFVTGHSFLHPSIIYWNTLIRFSFFFIMIMLISALRNAHEHEKELARFDNMTGAVNGRFFYELVQMEIDRSIRYKQQFTIVYFDLDNFKFVNDHFGHSIGDKVLKSIVIQSKNQLRKVDVVARLGGDEFALLLPETDQAAAQVAISKIQKSLLSEMNINKWPVTFSIGVLTCIKIPQTPDELIKQADDLMYLVKNNGKNSISYSFYTD